MLKHWVLKLHKSIGNSGNNRKQYSSALECLDREKFKDFYMRQNKTVRNPNFGYVLMEKKKLS